MRGKGHPESLNSAAHEFAATMDTSDIPDGKWVYNSAWEYEWDEEPREVWERYGPTF